MDAGLVTLLGGIIVGLTAIAVAVINSRPARKTDRNTEQDARTFAIVKEALTPLDGRMNLMEQKLSTIDANQQRIMDKVFK